MKLVRSEIDFSPILFMNAHDSTTQLQASF